MSKLSFMEKLLDGVEVEWKALGEIAEIYGGLSGKSKSDFEDGNARYIPYKNIFANPEVDMTNLELVKVSAYESQHEVRFGDVLFTGSSEVADEAGMSSAVTAQLEGPVYLNSFCFGLRFNENIRPHPGFLKHLFRAHVMRLEIARTASGVTRFNISKASFKKIRIPIPYPQHPEQSLEIQATIASTLDSFTELNTLLTSELTARKAQYKYYRDQLLSFKEGEVEWKTLGKIGEIIRGTAITEKETTPGEFPVVGNGPKHNYFHNKSNRNGETVVIARSGAYAGLVSYWNKSFFLTDAFSIHPDNKVLSTKFLYYVLKKDQLKIHLMGKGAGVPHVRASDFESYKVPVPLMAEQEHVVAVLDNFDTLTSSISEGLPREIELRQKQYEYYRDLLFSFPKPEAAS
jgi:type I restriction enzyme, S subunit